MQGIWPSVPSVSIESMRFATKSLNLVPIPLVPRFTNERSAEKAVSESLKVLIA